MRNKRRKKEDKNRGQYSKNYEVVACKKTVVTTTEASRLRQEWSLVNCHLKQNRFHEKKRKKSFVFTKLIRTIFPVLVTATEN